MVHTDQLERSIRLPKIPVRIVSLVPSQTELLVALGLSNSIVGVTKFCVHPDRIRKEKEIVGGTKQIHVAKIKQLTPDIILCNKEENTKEMVETLEEDFPVHVSDISTIDESLELIHQYGQIFNAAEQASILISEITAEMELFLKFSQDKPTKKVAYFIWRKPWMVAGNGTFIDHLLEINGFVNVFGNQDRYPEVSEEALDALTDVDLVLLSSEPFPFANKHLDEIQGRLPHTKVLLVDGEYFSWHGYRLKEAFTYFKTLHS